MAYVRICPQIHKWWQRYSVWRVEESIVLVVCHWGCCFKNKLLGKEMIYWENNWQWHNSPIFTINKWKITHYATDLCIYYSWWVIGCFFNFSLDAQSRGLGGHSHTETPSSLSSVSEVDDLMTALDLVDRVGSWQTDNEIVTQMADNWLPADECPKLFLE